MVSAAELRDLDGDELVTRLTEDKLELFNLRFRLATGQLDNTANIGRLKKEIARINTLLREREIEAAEAMEVKL
jgi:large subunit ribosomal protein L29